MRVRTLLASVSLAVTYVVAAATPVPAAVVNDTDGPLSLETNYASGLDTLTPGDSTQWTITTMLDDHLSGSLSIRVAFEGELAEHGTHLLLRQCLQPWQDGTCPGETHTIIDDALHVLDPDTRYPAGTITGPRGPYFLATITLPQNLPDKLQSSSLKVGLGFTALGDEELLGSPTSPTSPQEDLPVTGSRTFLPFLAAGLGALLAGTILRLRSRQGISR